MVSTIVAIPCHSNIEFADMLVKEAEKLMCKFFPWKAWHSVQSSVLLFKLSLQKTWLLHYNIPMFWA